MATQLFFRAAASDFGTGNNDVNLRSSAIGWTPRGLSLSRGSTATSLTLTTVAGPTAGIEFGAASAPSVWYSPPLNADITISGSVTWNLRASESSNSANSAVNARLEVIDGATGVITLIDQTARTTELSTSEAAVNFAETPGAGVACKRGDRLRVRVYGDDAAANMGASFINTFWFDGPTGAASGDSYVTLTENLTFASAPDQIAQTSGSITNALLIGSNNNSAKLAQGFTPGSSGDVSAVTLRLGTTGGTVTDGVTVEIRSDNAGEPSTTVLGSKTLLNAALTNDANNIFYFEPSVPVTGSTLYWIIVYRTGALDAVNWRSWWRATSNIYAGGAPKSRNGSDTAWSDFASNPTFDHTFTVDFNFGGTTIYPTDTASAVSTASVDREAWTSRGAGVQTDVTNTVAGWTAPIQITDTAGGTVVDWFTKQLTAFTLGGAVRVNTRYACGGTSRGVPRCEIARVASDGTSPTVWGATTWGSVSGVSTIELAQSFLVSGDDLAVTDGQRLRIRFYIDDSSISAMPAATTATLWYAGTSGGASGDTYLTFTQTLTEFSAGTTVTPTTAALVITKNIPTVTIPNPQLVTPTTKALTSATFAPQARTPILATPAAVSLTVTRFAPTVTTSNNQRVTPTTATLTATKYAPTVTTPERVTPTTKALALAAFAPTVTVAAGAITVTVPAGSLTLATFAPTISLAIRVTPNAVSLITSPQVPTVTASDHQRVTPTTKALALATFAPTVTTPSPQLVTPTTAALVATKYAPIVGTRYYAAAIATGPLVWWRHGEPSGTVADDEIGSIDATYINTPTLGVTGLITGDTNTAARFSRASLEYTTTFATMPAGSSAGVSIKGWVVFDTVTAATIYGIARWFHTTPVAEVQFYYHVSGNALRYLYQDATGFRNTFSDAWTPSTATRYFIVVTHDYSAETVKFYVNGALLSTEDVSAFGVPVVHAVNGNASVARVGSDYFDGIIDEPAFYNGVLTPTQVLALYNAGSGAAGPQLVTPTTAALVVTRYQPAVTTPQTFTPTTASLVATKYAPTVRLPILATPTTKALTVTRYEPTVRLHQLVTPQKATLTVTRFAPTVTTPIRAVPGTKALALTSFAAVVTAGNVQSVTPTTAALLLTKYVPVVSVTAHLAVTPPAATLTVTKFAPTVSATAHVAVIPGVKTLTLAPQVPTVALTAHVAVIVPKATLTITRYAPSLEQTNDVVAIPTTKSLTLSALTPTVTATANVAFAPTTKTVAITKFAPTVRTPILATPATKALTVTRFVPAVRTPSRATPATKALTLALYQPTLAAPLTVTPAKATLTTTRYAPTIVNPLTVTPLKKTLTLTTFAPAARVAATFTPITKALVLTGFAPTISTTFNAVVRPEYGELTITEYPPILDISGHQGIVPGTAVLVITPYAPTAEQHSLTPLPDLIYGFAIVAMGDSAGVGVENGGATVRSEGGGTAVLTSGPSARVTIR